MGELDEHRFYTLSELSKIFHLERRQILRLCADMKINYIQFGGEKRKRVYFTKRIIEDFLKNVK